MELRQNGVNMDKTIAAAGPLYKTAIKMDLYITECTCFVPSVTAQIYIFTIPVLLFQNCRWLIPQYQIPSCGEGDHAIVAYTCPKGKLNVVKISLGGSWGVRDMSRHEQDDLTFPLLLSAKSLNKFDYSR